MSPSRQPIRRTSQRVVRVLLLALLFSGADLHAQAFPPPPEDEAGFLQPLDPGTRVLPVWSNVSGRVEALLLLDPSSSGDAISPLDRLLAPERASPGIGLRLQTDGGAELRTSLRIEPDAGLALLCNGTLGASGALAALTDQCLLATLDHEDPLLRGLSPGAELQFGWQSPNDRLDLSFGLSWLHRDAMQPAAAAALMPEFLASSAAEPADFEAFNALGFWTSQLDAQSLRLDGLINLGPQARMLIGGNVSRSRLLGANSGAVNWDTASLSFGMGYRSFSGMVTGRLIEFPGRGSSWAGLDVGLSWRTPWRGELFIGARNVLGNGESPQWPLAELPALEEPAARVPYVRYHQDL